MENYSMRNLNYTKQISLQETFYSLNTKFKDDKNLPWLRSIKSNIIETKQTHEILISFIRPLRNFNSQLDWLILETHVIWMLVFNVSSMLMNFQTTSCRIYIWTRSIIRISWVQKEELQKRLVISSKRFLQQIESQLNLKLLKRLLAVSIKIS